MKTLHFPYLPWKNEGIADMCSFEGLSFIYEWLGFTEKGFMRLVLKMLQNTQEIILRW